MQQPVAIEDVAGEVDEILDAWRSKAIGILLPIACLAAFPALVLAVSGRLFHLVWPLRIVCILLYLVLVVCAASRRGNPRIRAALMLGVFALFGLMQLAVTQLAGDGKISLLMLPLLAVIFIGPRAGWWMAGLSIFLFAAVSFLIYNQFLSGLAVAEGVAARTGFWVLQGMRLTAHILVLTILLSKFHVLQRRTMIAERTAMKKLEAETADRKRLEIEVARVSEMERRNLGSELHDGLCQNLTSVLLNCTAIENLKAKGGNADVADIARIRVAIEESIGMAYDVARGLCPVDLDAEGLVSALESLCGSIRRRGMSCELKAGGNVTVSDPDCALQLYRIAGEALQNAARYSGGTQVEVILVRRPAELLLSVTDNGKGIADDARDGLGRGIMAYRAGLIGGTLGIESVAGRGTTVVCRIPLTEDAV